MIRIPILLPLLPRFGPSIRLGYGRSIGQAGYVDLALVKDVEREEMGDVG